MYQKVIIIREVILEVVSAVARTIDGALRINSEGHTTVSTLITG